MAEGDRAARIEPSRFFQLPSTTVGKWSGGLLLSSLAAIVVNAAVVQPMTERRPGSELLGRVFVWVMLAALLSAGVTGLVGVIAKRERSWVLFLTMLVLVAVLGFELVERVVSG